MNDTCGLYVDMPPEQTIVEGDWIATSAGSRYLVLSSRRVNRRHHHQQVRYSMRCARLPKNEPIPADVHVVWLQWYRR